MRAATRALCAAFAAVVPALVDGSASVERPLGTPAPVVWDPLPYGSVAPHGWLLEQLLTQANGLAGFMPTSTFPGALAVNTSRWVGGDGLRASASTRVYRRSRCTRRPTKRRRRV